jgi:hypothetical protein
MAPEDKIKEILNYIQNKTDADWMCLMCIKEDLEELVTIARGW